MKTMNIDGKQIHYVAENHRWMIGEKELGLCADGVLRGAGVVIQLSKDALAELRNLEQVALYESLDDAGKAEFVARWKHTLAVDIDFCRNEADSAGDYYDRRARKLNKASDSGDVFEMIRAYNER